MGELIGIHQQYGAVPAYIAQPTADQRRERHGGGILLLHDIWGLSDHVKSVADRLAAHGYDVVAPNLLNATGYDKRLSAELRDELYSPSLRTRNAAMPRYRGLTVLLDMPQLAALILGRTQASFEYLYNQPLLYQKVTVVGFGLGGTQAFNLAVRDSRIRGIVPFYAHAPRVQQMLQHISCPIMAFYPGKDGALTAEADALQGVFNSLRIEFVPRIYDDTLPGFFDDTSPFTYDAFAANDSWQRVLGFLQRQMI